MIALILLSIILSILLGLVILTICTVPTRVKKCPSDERLDGRTVIVTGANSGIGFEAAKEMARRGGRVILACRNEGRGTAAQDAIRQETGNQNVFYRNLDLGSLDSIRKFAKEIISTEKYVHVLVNNAGGYAYPDTYTKDGIVEIMQINYFGSFLLTLLLLPLLRKSKPSRVINVSSLLHWCGVINFEYLNKTQTYINLRSYANSKLCELLFTVELARKLEGTGVVANAIHPGVVNTNILKNVTSYGFMEGAFLFFCWFANTTAQVAAQGIVYLAVAKECGQVSGNYFADCQPAATHFLSKSRVKAKQLWEYSEKLVGQKCDM